MNRETAPATTPTATHALPVANTPVTETRLRVRYAETDQMGVVYYANYLIWMEVCRAELCQACGFVYRDMEKEDGIYLAVAEAHCQYRHPARYDDEVIVKSWIEKSNTRMLTVAYELRRAADDRRLAFGHTRHIFVSSEMRPTSLPKKYYPMFGIPETPHHETAPSAPPSA